MLSALLRSGRIAIAADSQGASATTSPKAPGSSKEQKPFQRDQSLQHDTRGAAGATPPCLPLPLLEQTTSTIRRNGIQTQGPTSLRTRRCDKKGPTFRLPGSPGALSCLRRCIPPHEHPSQHSIAPTPPLPLASQPATHLVPWVPLQPATSLRLQSCTSLGAANPPKGLLV